MKLKGLHLLLTYQCSLECDHCFVWGSPRQSGTMTLDRIQQILQQAKDLATVEWIYFEGGEPFLFYPILNSAVKKAAGLGFQVGIVTNGYWATETEDAAEWLRPFAGLIQDLSISGDLYHRSEEPGKHVRNASAAAEKVGIPVGVISIAQPEESNAASAIGQLPTGESAVMYRGRAVEKLVERATRQPWEKFSECPYEDLRGPDRIHVDPFGNVHICQGISLGNLSHTSLREICEAYDPDSHPITGALLDGGPAELVRRHGLPHAEAYADACHLCYDARCALRKPFPEILIPDQMYGVVESE